MTFAWPYALILLLVVPLLVERVPYRRIHELTGVSVTTIGRVARFLSGGNGGYRTVLERLSNKT